MTDQQVKIATVGYGYWGRNLMRVFSQAEGAEVAVCCESNEDRHQEIRELYPKTKIFDTDLKVTLARQDIDAVILATPAGMHYEQAKAALQAGKHVFVEKPLATSTVEADELVQLAKDGGRKLMVGHTFLYNDAVSWIKQYIDSGELGEIYYIYMQRLALGRVRNDVDALWNLAPHDISIALYWLGETPDTISSQGMSFLQDGIDDISFLNLTFPSRKFAHIHVSWLDPSKTRKAVLVGSKKMVIYDDTSVDQKIVICDKGVDRKHIEDTWASKPFLTYGEFALIQRAGDITIPKINLREPLKVEAQHFVDCIRNDTTPASDGVSGRNVTAILEAATRSRKEQQIVKMG